MFKSATEMELEGFIFMFNGVAVNVDSILSNIIVVLGKVIVKAEKASIWNGFLFNFYHAPVSASRTARVNNLLFEVIRVLNRISELAGIIDLSRVA